MILIYLFGFLILLFVLSISQYVFEMPLWYLENINLFRTTYMGLLGGLLYCIRAVYLNKCVYNRWDKNWLIWYYLRPISSSISGLISFIFLKAGLLILSVPTNGTENSIQNSYGYLAIAFIAGYNVDNFLKKIEAVAESALGVNKSRTSSLSERDTRNSS